MNLFQAEVTTPTEFIKLIIEADTFSEALDRIFEIFNEDAVEELSITQLNEEDATFEQLGNRFTGLDQFKFRGRS